MHFLTIGGVTLGWGGVGWGGVLTFWRPRPWYYVDKTCRGNLEDVLDATLMGWGGVGWGGVLTSWRPRPWYYVDKTRPKRSWWKIHTQSPCVPFSNTKSTHGLGVRTWASCPQRSFCGSSPKFGEQHSSLPAFFAEENKKSFCQESPQTKQKSQWNVNEFSIAWNSSNGFPSRRNMSREPSS